MSRRALTLDLTLPEGIHGNWRGEGRWTVNVALLLKEVGFDVYCPTECDISSEYVDKQEGINFIRKLDGIYDLYFSPVPMFDQPIWQQNVFPYIRKFLVGSFFPSEVLLNRLPSNSLLVTPYFPQCAGIKTLPYIYGDIEESKFENKTMIWTSRSLIARPSGPGAAGDICNTDVYQLRTIVEAVRLGYKAIFMNYFDEWTFSSVKENERVIEAQNIIRELKSNPLVEFYGFLPQDKFSAVMRRGSIIFPASMGGSMPAALLWGLAPVLFHCWFYPYFFNKEFIPESDIVFKDYFNVPYDAVKTKIFSLLTDKAYYDNYLQEVRNATPLFTKKMAINNLQEALNILGI